MATLAKTNLTANSVILNRWRIEGDLGKGSFSSVFSGNFHEATDLLTHASVAIKVPNSLEGAEMLQHEAALMRRLVGSRCVPEIVAYVDNPACLVMARIGSTLADLYSDGKHMSVKTCCMTAIAAVSALEAMHDRGIIHRDVKPDNIAFSLNAQTLYFLDLGLSAKVIHNGMHVASEDGVPFNGSPYFASEAVLRGIRASRRDDLESLGYVLLFLLKGSLPWIKVDFSASEDLQCMISARTGLSLRKICVGAPAPFLPYFTYCKGLDFAETPNYAYLKQLFTSTTELENITITSQFDRNSMSKAKKEHKKEHCNNLRENMHLLAAKWAEAAPGEKIELLRKNSQIERINSGNCTETPVEQPRLDVSRLRMHRNNTQAFAKPPFIEPSAPQIEIVPAQPIAAGPAQ